MRFFNFHKHNSSDFGIYNLSLGEEIPDFMFSAGIHPKDILEDFKAQFSWLKNVATHKNCLAIGECGLDALISVSDELQKKVFQQQISLANDLQKPIIIHCVRKFQELPNFKKNASVPMVIHGFNKRETIGNKLLADGFYLSFGKSLLQNVDLQEFFKKVPINKLFLETDASEIEIKEIYQKASELKNISSEKLNLQIEENLEKIGILI